MLTLVVSLYIHAGREAEFERFEAEAARTMSRFGGRIERRLRRAAATDQSHPDAVHLVTFPDAESFDCYRLDSELVGLAALRSQAIRQTTIWAGVALSPFADSA